MTRERIDKHLDVMKAFAEGKDIQFLSYDNSWVDVTNDPAFSLNVIYRIKPEPELIPLDFSDAEKLIGKTIKSKDGTVFGHITLVRDTDNGPIKLGDLNYNYEYLLTHFEFLDGTPIGKWVTDNA